MDRPEDIASNFYPIADNSFQTLEDIEARFSTNADRKSLVREVRQYVMCVWIYSQLYSAGRHVELVRLITYKHDLPRRFFECIRKLDQLNQDPGRQDDNGCLQRLIAVCRTHLEITTQLCLSAQTPAKGVPVAADAAKAAQARELAAQAAVIEHRDEWRFLRPFFVLQTTYFQHGHNLGAPPVADTMDGAGRQAPQQPPNPAPFPAANQGPAVTGPGVVSDNRNGVGARRTSKHGIPTSTVLIDPGVPKSQKAKGNLRPIWTHQFSQHGEVVFNDEDGIAFRDMPPEVKLDGRYLAPAGRLPEAELVPVYITDHGFIYLEISVNLMYEHVPAGAVVCGLNPAVPHGKIRSTMESQKAVIWEGIIESVIRRKGRERAPQAIFDRACADNDGIALSLLCDAVKVAAQRQCQEAGDLEESLALLALLPGLEPQRELDVEAYAFNVDRLDEYAGLIVLDDRIEYIEKLEAFLDAVETYLDACVRQAKQNLSMTDRKSVPISDVRLQRRDFEYWLDAARLIGARINESLEKLGRDFGLTSEDDLRVLVARRTGLFHNQKALDEISDLLQEKTKLSEFVDSCKAAIKSWDSGDLPPLVEDKLIYIWPEDSEYEDVGRAREFLNQLRRAKGYPPR